ncbi:hypothetical protein EX30DRAFT_369930 [Ascodesmis nigricans]|uniref:Uncharacterized protein n=1 Tax=Ascodesmis nigricans TaxID=341454 RepID=A0A4S2N178_9PEZI|nr:hypothetical protein EX30DRAFT_369930 [Ascodesmis nigricans]
MSSLTPPLRLVSHHRAFNTHAILYSVPRQGVQVKRSAPPPRPQPPLPKSPAAIDELIAELDAFQPQKSIPPTKEEKPASSAHTRQGLPPPIQVQSPLTQPSVKVHRKIPEQRPHTVFHSELIKNPYAQILASDVRMDHDFLLRLPADLLIRFIAKRNPDKNEFWILPDGNRSPRVYGSGGYSLAIKQAIERYSIKKGFSKFLPPQRRGEVMGSGNVVWRNDMPEFVQKDMVDEICRRLVETGFKWGRDLEWIDKPQEVESQNEEGERKIPLGILDWEDPGGPRVDTVGEMVLPCFNMRDMIGEEKVAEISNKWIVKKTPWLQGTKTLVYNTKQTTGLVKELMKLRSYLEMWEAADELGEEGELPQCNAWLPRTVFV